MTRRAPSALASDGSAIVGRIKALPNLATITPASDTRPKLEMAANGPGAAATSSTGSHDYLENGRLYHGYRRGMYMYPCDEQEKNRMDMFHQLFLTARHDDLHTAPIVSADDVRILDLGTGTGIWAIDMADKYRHAEVVGLDLANIQPQEIPENLRFNVRVDYQSPWTLGEASWDLIHLRQGCGSVQSWPALYQKIFNHLKPGTGSFEQVEIDLTPRCDDGTLPYEPVVQWYEYLVDATAQANRPVAYQPNTREMLEVAGFVNIQEQIIRLPFNTWPRDPQQKSIGRWYCAGMLEWIDALSIGPFTRVFDWDAETIARMTQGVKKSMLVKKYHGYNKMHIWTAKRPREYNT